MQKDPNYKCIIYYHLSKMNFRDNHMSFHHQKVLNLKDKYKIFYHLKRKNFLDIFNIDLSYLYTTNMKSHKLEFLYKLKGFMNMHNIHNYKHMIYNLNLHMNYMDNYKDFPKLYLIHIISF